MNDIAIHINVDLDTLHRRGIDVEDVDHLLTTVLFNQLKALWGCAGDVSYSYGSRTMEIRIGCPALLARGLEDKLHDIFNNPQDRSLYEVDSYPQDRRLNIAVPPGMAQVPRMDSFAAEYIPDSIPIPGGYTHGDTVMRVPKANEHVTRVEVPPPKRKRIISIDIK